MNLGLGGDCGMSETNDAAMSGTEDDIFGGMARLEAALERIAALSAARPAPASDDVARVETAQLAQRLDTIIARLRAIIDEA